MRIRTVLYLMLGAIGVVALSVLYTANRVVFNEPIVFGRRLTLPVWLTLLMVCAVSMLLPLMFGMLRDLQRMFRNLGSRRSAGTQQEVETLYLKGVESMLNGREERALEHFNAVLALAPDHFDALLKSGEVLRTMRRFAEAIEVHRRAARLRESDLRALYSLVADYEDSGATESARAILNRIIELAPKRSLNAYRKYRAICISEAEWEKAWEIQQRIEEQLADMGRSRKGERKYHLGIRTMLAQRLIDQGKERDAIGVLRRIVKTDPAFVPAHLKLGRALALLHQPEEAVEAWEEGYAATQHPVFLSTIENHYLEQEQPRRAIEALKAAVWKTQKEVIPRFFLGKLYYRLEMIEDALQQFTLMKDQVTYFPALHFHLAKIMERQGNFREAIRELEILLGEADVLRVEYACGVCARRFTTWVDYCERCGEWNSVVVDFREERPVEELGISSAPVYTAGAGAEEAQG